MTEHSEAQPVVFVVDDDPSTRTSLTSLIRSVDLAVEAFASPAEFLAARRPDAPCCLILDVRLPGASGLDFQAELAKSHIHLPIIFITGHGDIPMTVKAMKAGAVEFLTKPFDGDVLLDAIRHALDRSRRTLEHDAKMRALRESYGLLTPREREVMTLVASGLLNKQVGGELGISEITVKAHRGQVMRKMKAQSLPALVHMVTSLGLARAATF